MSDPKERFSSPMNIIIGDSKLPDENANPPAEDAEPAKSDLTSRIKSILAKRKERLNNKKK